MDSIEVIPVNLGDRSYEIFVGSNMLKDLGETIQKKCGQKKILIVTDEDVASFWLNPVIDSLKQLASYLGLSLLLLLDIILLEVIVVPIPVNEFKFKLLI